MPEKSKAAMGAAASRGWFFGWNDSLQGLMELIEKLEAFTDEIVSKYPARAAVIKAAVKAHMTLGSEGYLKSTKARQLAEQTSGQTFTALNQHQGMQGESSDYGTEINSLRALSFLMHVGAHLPAILEDDASVA